MSLTGGGSTFSTAAASFKASLGSTQGTGIFAEQADRLLRTRWSDPNLLAEELYTIFMSVEKLAGNSQPIAYNAPGNPNTPSQMFKGFAPNQPLFTFQRPNGPVIALTPSGFTADGQPIPWLQFPTTSNDGAPLPSFPPAVQPPQKSGGGGDAGTITGGSGNDYTVELISGEEVEASTQGVAEDDAIPAGTFVILSNVDDEFFFQAPIWLG